MSSSSAEGTDCVPLHLTIYPLLGSEVRNPLEKRGEGCPRNLNHDRGGKGVETVKLLASQVHVRPAIKVISYYLLPREEKSHVKKNNGEDGEGKKPRVSSNIIRINFTSHLKH